MLKIQRKIIFAIQDPAYRRPVLCLRDSQFSKIKISLKIIPVQVNLIFWWYSVLAPKKPHISKPKEPQTYPPKDRKLVNIAVGNNVTSLLNTPIKIVCSATGSPKPRITWMKNGKALDQSDDRYSIFENGTLLIAQASPEDQGKYTCIAKNKEGQDNASSTVEITSK